MSASVRPKNQQLGPLENLSNMLSALDGALEGVVDSALGRAEDTRLAHPDSVPSDVKNNPRIVDECFESFLSKVVEKPDSIKPLHTLADRMTKQATEHKDAYNSAIGRRDPKSEKMEVTCYKLDAWEKTYHTRSKHERQTPGPILSKVFHGLKTEFEERLPVVQSTIREGVPALDLAAQGYLKLSSLLQGMEKLRDKKSSISDWTTRCEPIYQGAVKNLDAAKRSLVELRMEHFSEECSVLEGVVHGQVGYMDEVTDALMGKLVSASGKPLLRAHEFTDFIAAESKKVDTFEQRASELLDARPLRRPDEDDVTLDVIQLHPKLSELTAAIDAGKERFKVMCEGAAETLNEALVKEAFDDYAKAVSELDFEIAKFEFGFEVPDGPVFGTVYGGTERDIEDSLESVGKKHSEIRALMGGAVSQIDKDPVPMEEILDDDTGQALEDKFQKFKERTEIAKHSLQVRGIYEKLTEQKVQAQTEIESLKEATGGMCLAESKLLSGDDGSAYPELHASFVKFQSQAQALARSITDLLSASITDSQGEEHSVVDKEELLLQAKGLIEEFNQRESLYIDPKELKTNSAEYTEYEVLGEGVLKSAYLYAQKAQSAKEEDALAASWQEVEPLDD